MKNKVSNLQELSKEVNIDLFYAISFFESSETSLQGKANEALKEITSYCNDDFKYSNGNLIGKFEYNGCNYRVVLTF